MGDRLDGHTHTTRERKMISKREDGAHVRCNQICLGDDVRVHGKRKYTRQIHNRSPVSTSIRQPGQKSSSRRYMASMWGAASRGSKAIHKQQRSQSMKVWRLEVWRERCGRGGGCHNDRFKTNPEVRMPDEKDGTNAKAGHNPNVDPFPIGMTVKYVMKYWPHGTHHRIAIAMLIQLASQLPKSLQVEKEMMKGVPNGFPLGEEEVAYVKLMHENQ